MKQTQRWKASDTVLSVRKSIIALVLALFALLPAEAQDKTISLNMGGEKTPSRTSSNRSSRRAATPSHTITTK